jgi:hypothetical protein
VEEGVAPTLSLEAALRAWFAGALAAAVGDVVEMFFGLTHALAIEAARPGLPTVGARCLLEVAPADTKVAHAWLRGGHERLSLAEGALVAGDVFTEVYAGAVLANL